MAPRENKLQRGGKKSTKGKRQGDSSWGAAAAVAGFPETNDWVSSKKGQQERALNCRATFDGIFVPVLSQSVLWGLFQEPPWSVSQRSHTHVHTSIEWERVFFRLCPSHSPPKRSTQNNSNQVLKCEGHKRVTKSLEVAAVNQASNCSQLKSSPPLSHSLVQYAKQQQHKNLTLKRTEDFRKSRESRTPFLSDEESLQSCSHAVRKKINNSQQHYTWHIASAENEKQPHRCCRV